MKHLNKLLFSLVSMLALSSQAQNSNNPWAISLGVNAIDTRVSAGGGKNEIDSRVSQPFMVRTNWNFLPSISYISLERFVGNNFSVGLQGSVNKMVKFVVYDPSNSGRYVAANPGNIMTYIIDANVKYSFMSLIKSKMIDPTISFGGGLTHLGSKTYTTVNPGVGLTFWLTENVGFTFATKYKKSFGNRSSSTNQFVPDSPTYVQHSAGITYQFGGKDTDGDGIYDKEDKCPNATGLKEFNGCPDTDGDGIIDGNDACPTENGLATLNGCPDKDGDGIIDKDDACPNIAGVAALKGCKDTDGDQVIDIDDKCPNEVGPKFNEGCPVLDADNDGIPNSEDECPSVAGAASRKGCPEITKEKIEELKVQAKSIFFNSGMATFKYGDGCTTSSLDYIFEVLQNYPNTIFSIEGHTDSDGSEEFNQKLSEDRANSVRNALINRGANPENLIAVGFGETNPVDDNETVAGKAENRRTEVIQVGAGASLKEKINK